MKNKLLGVMLSLVLLVSAIGVLTIASPAAAALTPTTSLTVTRWGAGNTILFQNSIDYATMESSFPVLGDGQTEYFHQGPILAQYGSDPYTSDETIQKKTKGTPKGTNLKDLCIWAGESDGQIGSTTTIRLTASDGLFYTFPYDNVYTPPAAQGPAVICWYNPAYGGYPPTFSSGMRFIFMAPDYVYGNYDMIQTMPAAYQYFYQPGYPSTDGLSVKCISNIDIYTSAAPTWTLELDGTAIGGTSFDVTDQYFAEGVAHHGAETFNTSAWGDGSSNIYSGMPLWLLCGYVDDNDPHSGVGAFNDAIAASGYVVRVEDALNDSYSTELSSQDIARSNNFIVANLKNGSALTGGEYPLRLVGNGVTKGRSTKNTVKIELLSGNTLTMAVNGSGTVTPSAGSHTYTAGTVVNISATPAGGWQFDGWTGDVAEPGSASTTVTMDASKTLTASFSMITSYQVDVSSNPAEGGSVAPGSGQYIGSNQFTATANPGYQFVDWTIDSVEGETANPLTLDVQAATTLVANFALIPTYQVDVSSNPVEGGSVAPGSGMYGGSTQFTAAANPGYQFVDWTIDSVEGETANPLNLDIQAATVLVANFELTPTFQVDVSSNPAAGGSVSPESGMYGGSTQFTATANAGYQFLNWTINGVPGNTTNPLTLDIQAATTLVANFQWVLQLDGTAIGGTTFTVTQEYFEEGVDHHGAVTWTDTAWGSTNTYSGMPLWLLCGYVDDAIQHDQAGAFNDALAASGYLVKVSSGGYYKVFSSQDVARNSGFLMANMKNGAALTGSDYPLRLLGSYFDTRKGQSVKAVDKIELLPGNTLTMAVNGDGTVTPAAGNHTYESGTIVDISATPANGSHFSHWTGDVADPNSASTAVTMDAGKTVTAIFTSDVNISVNAPAIVDTDVDFTASIDVDNISNFNVADYTITFDPAVLRLDNITDGNIDSTAVPVFFNQNPAGTVKVVNDMNMPATGISGGGSLAVLHFHVLGTPGQSSQINIGDGTLASNMATEILASWTGGTVTIVPIPVTVTLGNLEQTYDGTPKAVTVITDPAGLAYTITYDGGATEPVNAGSYAVVVTITEPNYEGSASDTLVINKADQVINFDPIEDKGYASPDFDITATASSGLPVTFTASGSCTISGTTVHITGTGTGTITASQAGNENYNPAPDVSRTFNILVTPGDTNGDGKINAIDITATIRIVLGLDPATDTADANGDGKINSLDIAQIELIILNSN